MCRFILFKGEESVLLADLLTRPAHSIINQSFDSKLRVDLHRPLNGDGFGIGWYDDQQSQQPQQPQYQLLSVNSTTTTSSQNNTVLKSSTAPPCIFTSVLPAWNNPNLNRLAEKLRSPLVFCHVRAASPGFPISETNCHPFQYGNLMFMHNGFISNFRVIKRRVEALLPDPIYHSVNGNTDSEHCFALFLSFLGDPKAPSFSQEEMAQAVFKTISTLNQFSREAGVTDHHLMNFAISDGNIVVCTRYTNDASQDPASLFYSSGSKFVCTEDSQYRMIKDDKRPHMTIVASEPLTFEKSDWVAIPKNTLMVLTRKQNVLFYPIPN